MEGLRRAEKSSLVLEGGLLAASLYSMGPWGKPLRTGKIGAWFFGGTVVGGLLAPFALLQGRESRGRSLLASLLVLIGGYLLRRTIIDAGSLSARDPQATFTFAQQENLPLRDQNVQGPPRGV